MKRAIAIFILLTLAGCVENICPQNLDVREETRVDSSDYETVFSLNKVVDKSISVGGEVHTLKIYSYANGTYYAEFQPIHFSVTRLYGPFPPSYEEDLECN